MKRLWLIPLLFGGVAVAVLPRTVHAYNLNLFAGSNLHSKEDGLAVVELTIPVVAEVGPFFEWSRTTAAGPENRYIVGVMGRTTTPWLNFFVDSRAGYQCNNGFNLEFGLGYRFVGNTIDILPRFGINAVTANGNVPDFDLSLGVAIVL